MFLTRHNKQKKASNQHFDDSVSDWKHRIHCLLIPNGSNSQIFTAGGFFIGCPWGMQSSHSWSDRNWNYLCFAGGLLQSVFHLLLHLSKALSRICWLPGGRGAILSLLTCTSLVEWDLKIFSRLYGISWSKKNTILSNARTPSEDWIEQHCLH